MNNDYRPAGVAVSQGKEKGDTMSGNKDLTMMTEWEAWKEVVVPEFSQAVGDINNFQFRRLIFAIQRWAEFLVRLRLEQSPVERERAFKDNCQRYQRECKKADKIADLRRKLDWETPGSA